MAWDIGDRESLGARDLYATMGPRSFFHVRGQGRVAAYDGKNVSQGNIMTGSETVRFMRRVIAGATIALVGGSVHECCAQEKDALYGSVAAQADEGWKAAKQIWEWAEPGYQETQSSQLLAEMLESSGFSIERGVAGIPTAFIAQYGSGSPVIGILGEFDALPGLSQEAVPEPSPREAGGYGHGCGHHLFGVASALAARAVADQIRGGHLQGTVRFYACPAEEGGAAKTFMVRDGLFDDCDIALHWHPGNRNAAGGTSCLSRIAAKFRFRGTSAHAASAPEQGRSSLDAVELTNHAAQLLREHTPDFTRIHHIVTAGGGAPNVVPDFAEVYFYVRHPKSEVARSVYERLVKCAEAGALATETKLEIEYLGGTAELVPNHALSALIQANLRARNQMEYSEEERSFAVRIQNTLAAPAPLETIANVVDTTGDTGKGSTDVGDVSWAVPTAGFSTACWVPGTPAHSWQATASGGTTIGRKGMLLAAEVLAATTWDLMRKPASVEAARQEHANRVGDHYQSLLNDDQTPPLDYRDAAKQ